MADSKIENEGLLGDSSCLPEGDIDCAYNSEQASRIVEEETENVEVVEVKPATKTTAFYTMVATSLAGVVALILVNKGFIGPEQIDLATSAMATVFSGIIAAGMAWVAGKFIEARGKVSVAKLQLAMSRTPSPVGGMISGGVSELREFNPLGFLSKDNILSLLPFILSLAIQALEDKKGTKTTIKSLQEIKVKLAKL